MCVFYFYILTIFYLGEPSPFVRMIFTLNSCSPIVGNHVFCYEKEIDMLEGFAELMRLVDPDIITGYNIMNFDTSYLGSLQLFS